MVEFDNANLALAIGEANGCPWHRGDSLEIKECRFVRSLGCIDIMVLWIQIARDDYG